MKINEIFVAGSHSCWKYWNKASTKPADLPKQALQKWKKQPCTRVLGKLPGKVVIRAISKSQTNYAGSTSTSSSSALEWST
ncbi:hypothetical protein T05_6250 [Trichinella murrelli]|uniref:Uncharacterized protein n=1 Tax=Trichinella murrelli TaxID=144512 RepID=A0A0V0TK22_9BILA|nr:hypothetical protein T05_6250 [Trichinella murrelli]